MNKGTLTLCATPIGNLGDVTDRLRKALSEADVIAAEDTRRTLGLLSHLGIKKSIFSCHRHNEDERARQIADMLLQGKNVALVSDAGMPCISDPGEAVVKMALSAGCAVEAIPGPSAALTALALSGLDTTSFTFIGFLPRDGKTRKKALGELAGMQRTAILYEAPHRLGRTLDDLIQTAGERRVSISRELTKVHEETFRGTLSEAAAHFSEGARGEITLVLEGAGPPTRVKAEPKDGELERRLEEWIAQGLTKGEAAKMAAEAFSISRNEAYLASTKLGLNKEHKG
jgi:16S rRNA (cytidine1402-2'-O)-methyltransferase